MNLTQFVSAHNGQYLDFDGVYGAQCVDLVLFYLRDVCGLPPLPGNAIDEFGENPTGIDWIRSDPGNPNQVPPPGAIVIWGPSYRVGTGVMGHTAVVIEANAAGFRSFDQNWPVNAPCHIVAHIYDGVIGWGIPKTISIGGFGNLTDQEIQARFVAVLEGIAGNRAATDAIDGAMFYPETDPKWGTYSALLNRRLEAAAVKAAGGSLTAQQSQELQEAHDAVIALKDARAADLAAMLAQFADLKAHPAVLADTALAASIDALGKHLGIGAP